MPVQTPLESRSGVAALEYLQGAYSGGLDRCQHVMTVDSTTGASLSWLSGENPSLPQTYKVVRFEIPRRWGSRPTIGSLEVLNEYSGWPLLIASRRAEEFGGQKAGLADLTSAADSLLPIVQSAPQRDQAKQFLAELRNAVSRHGFLFSRPLSAIVSEDGALLLEWAFQDRRLLFVLTPECADSSWSFVSELPGRPRNAWGLLSDLDLHQVIAWIAA